MTQIGCCCPSCKFQFNFFFVQILIKEIRGGFGRKNLIKKTLIDKRFLIWHNVLHFNVMLCVKTESHLKIVEFHVNCSMKMNLIIKLLHSYFSNSCNILNTHLCVVYVNSYIAPLAYFAKGQSIWSAYPLFVTISSFALHFSFTRFSYFTTNLVTYCHNATRKLHCGWPSFWNSLPCNLWPEVLFRCLLIVVLYSQVGAPLKRHFLLQLQLVFILSLIFIRHLRFEPILVYFAISVYFLFFYI